MVKLWYSDDEVKKFHPEVQACLETILRLEGAEGDFGIRHHPVVPGSTKTPDFSIYHLRSRRTVFILEVKRSERDVDSQRYWNQTRGYVRDLTQEWEPGYRYFAITNLEKTISFADRDGADIICILAGNPIASGKFEPISHEADSVIENFTLQLRPLIAAALQNQKPVWADAWSPIIDSFVANLNSASAALVPHVSEPLAKEIATYELLRLFFYQFMGSYYSYSRSPNASYFRPIRLAGAPHVALQELHNNYARALELGFSQIFSESPVEGARLDLKKFELIAPYIQDLSRTLTTYLADAIIQNHSPKFFFDLLTNSIYTHSQLHETGKVMSDSELAGLLAELTIRNVTDTVLDPGSGDGSLLDASYDKLKRLGVQSHPTLLSQINGIELDPFLTQLSTFRLMMKSPHEITDTAKTGILSGDIFTQRRSAQYDAVLMNPPFLRNEESMKLLIGSSAEDMVRAIKNTEVDPFVEKASQPNHYFYFLNYAYHYLNDGGTMGVILMSKFMTNKDAVHLKEFMLDKIEAVISYPKNFFKDFRVTTSIVILGKKARSDSVTFLNVRSESLLGNPEKIREILGEKTTAIEPDYSRHVVPRRRLDPAENWRTYLIDPEEKYNQLQKLESFVSLSELFEECKRGGAGNSGASDMIYPSTHSDLTIAQNVPREFLEYGLKNNKLRTKSFILNDAALMEQAAIHFPAAYNSAYEYGYDPLINDAFFEELYKEAALHYPKWRQILTQTLASRIGAQLVVPRADREKHAVYYNATKQPIVLSTNFFALSGFKNTAPTIELSLQLKFITAYLLSSFGQIQFELVANDHEGLRKLEGFMIDQLGALDPAKIDSENIHRVVEAFEKLNQQGVSFSGIEGTNSPRHELDHAVAEVLISLGIQGFENAQKVARFAQLFLADLVEERAH